MIKGKHMKPETKSATRFVALLMCLIMFFGTISILPHHVLAAPSNPNDADIISHMDKVVDWCLANHDSSAGTNDNEMKHWKNYLVGNFYSTTTLHDSVVIDDDETSSTFGTVTSRGATGSLNWNYSSGVSDDWKWSGTTATGTAATSSARPSSKDAIPYFDAVSLTYYVWSGEQLRYALDQIDGYTQAGQSGYTIEIMADIDLNGQAGSSRNWLYANLLKATTIKGNSHCIFNLRVDFYEEVRNNGVSDGGYCSFLGKVVDLTMTDLNFDSAFICSVDKVTDGGGGSLYIRATGIIGWFTSTNIATPALLQNIHIKNSLVVGTDTVGVLVARISTNAADGTVDNRKIVNCSLENAVTFGRTHIGSLGGAVGNCGRISQCFSVGSTVYSLGYHSGGLFSCLGNAKIIDQCFVDASVYGTSQTGVFSGVGTGSTHFYNCYSSGFVEGNKQLGGFVGLATSGTGGDGKPYFINCYSTALVGMRSSGTYLGGFIGEVDTNNYTVGIINCYAAGEVGSADTIVTNPSAAGINHLDTNGNEDFVGGFIGNAGTADFRLLTAYSYYDKQTTAMREWDSGSGVNTRLTVQPGRSGLIDETRSSVSDGAQGLAGVLTTSSSKGGTGLTAAPGTSGFIGFFEMDEDKDGFFDAPMNGSAYEKTPYSGGWDYTALNHYPELECFSSASADDWGTYANIVRDYSKASTSTVLLETWEKTLNEETGVLKKDTTNSTTYDTVRDLTIRFDMTGDATHYRWYRTGTATVTPKPEDNANTNGAEVDLAGVEKSIMTVSTRYTNSIQHYYADQFYPGLEWLLVTYGSAQRRLRVMPTVGVEAGDSTTIYRPSDELMATYNLSNPADVEKLNSIFYDHADDVELYYSTAARLDDDSNDITTGIFPDAGGTGTYASNKLTRTENALTDRQLLLMSNETTAADINDYFITRGNDTYGIAGGTPNTYPGVDVSFMSRKKNDQLDGLAIQNNSANDSKVFVYGRIVEKIDSVTGEITTGNKLLDFTDANVAETFNGLALIDHEDCMVMLEYIWRLADGRTVSDAKLITIRATPFETRITAHDAGGLSGGSELDANKLILDTANGLLDSDDMKVDMLRYKGILLDANVVSELSGFGSVSKVTQDRLLPYTVYPAGNPLAGQTVPDELIGPEYMDGLVASWTVLNSEKAVSKVTLSMDSGRNDESGKKYYFTSTLNNPKDGDTIIIPYEYYRYITADNGSFFVSTEHLNRTYTVRSTVIGEYTVFYLVFNHNTTGTTNIDAEVDVVDVANNITVDLELSASFEMDKVVSGDYADAEQKFEFTLTLDDQTDSDTHFYSYSIYNTVTKATTTQNGTGDALTVTNGDNIIYLKHGDKLHIVGLPYGAEYTLSETDYSDISYLTTLDNVAGRTVTGSLTVTPMDAANPIYTADRQHSFHNNKYIPPATGILMDNIPFICMVLLVISGFVWIGISAKRRKRYFQD